MSVAINWSELISNPYWLETLKTHLETLFETKVNHPPSGAKDDGTKIHLLELEFGQTPPIVELTRLGMEDGEKHMTDDHNATATAATVDGELSTASTPRGGRHSRHVSTSSTVGVTCPVHRSPAAAIPFPPISLRGRFAYSGDAHLTLQIRRQVNPYVSTVGLIGRLGRSHHRVAAMDQPMEAELWVRISGINIECEVQVTYTPEVKAQKPIGTLPIPSSSSQSDTHDLHTHSNRNTLSTPRSRAASPSPASASSRSSTPIIRRTTTPRPVRSASPQPHGAYDLHAHTPHHHHPPPPCTCPATSVGSASAAAAAPAPAPALVSVLIERDPLRGLTITSALDGSPAGEKLRSTFQAQIATALKKIVGQRIQIPLPPMNK